MLGAVHGDVFPAAHWWPRHTRHLWDSPFAAPVLWLVAPSVVVTAFIVILQVTPWTMAPGGPPAGAVAALPTGTSHRLLTVRVERVQDGWRVINAGHETWTSCLARIDTAQAPFSLTPFGSIHLARTDFHPQPADWREPRLSCATGARWVEARITP